MVGRLAPEIMNRRMQIPVATYRLQLNHAFTFAQATEVVPYLSGLGISHCYISPCLKARPGSMHGYDIVDHNSFNPEIGTAEDFDRFVTTLHQHEMGLVLDIVPNHMGIMGSDNAWWLDVLENGQSSLYSEFFDIDWLPLKDELHGKVLIPVLHDHYGAVLESGELKLVFQLERGEFDVRYNNHRFPVDPREYPRILQRVADALVGKLGEQNLDLLEFQSLITAFKNLPARNELGGERVAERNRDKEIHKRRLAELCVRSPEIAAEINMVIDQINGRAGDPASFEDLHELIKTQTFRLANWRVASDDINYRRFFDTNDLAGICVENEAVFEATHRFVLDLMAQGKVDGLRVDHPDGLYNPAHYLDRLKREISVATGNSKREEDTRPETEKSSRYVVIEKILTGPERLPAEWPVDGTTGYDFSNLVNGLFVDSTAVKRFEHLYRNLLGDEIDIDDLFYHCRKLIIRVALASELNVLANQLSRIALSKRRTCDFTLNSLRDALTEVVATFPVYRTYVVPSGASERDTNYISDAVAAAKWRSPANDTSIFDFIREVLLTRIAEGQDAAYRNTVTAFAMKFQQFTSPVMAKGLEDTAFYRYNRLVSLNDVGGDLHRFGITPVHFHAANQERLRGWPHAMLTTSTHDSKRSEDVRSRINVLSEMAGLWRLRLRDWKRFNRGHKRVVNGKPAPSANDEYLLYQTLVGAWPSQPLDDKDERKNFQERIESYMLKALREGKQNTSWINRNAEYEEAVSAFVNALINPGPKNRFLSDFIAFERRVKRLGIWNSLSQTLLKLTCPGVPDTYQGNELWDFSLVDPDNRRPIDYALRQQAFKKIRALGSEPRLSSVRSLLESPEDGLIKMYLMWRTLCLRRHQPELFSHGEYVPLAVGGEKNNHIVAFARRSESATAMVIVPRLVAGLLGGSDLPPIGDIWGDTYISLPDHLRAVEYRNAFTGENMLARTVSGQLQIDLATALQDFPVAVCVSS
jgi:(1->4)-alpha-D-glucan 1-alpha-D-glucosylmutase